MKFIDYPVIIVVWTQEGCPACEEFLPVWRPIAEAWQNCVPSVAVKCDDYKIAADYYRVQNTPTAMIMRYGRPSWKKLQGAVTAEEIKAFYETAAVGMDCQLA